MCRILEAIIRNYKRQNERDQYNRSMVDIMGGKTEDVAETEASLTENSSMFYQPTDDVGMESKYVFN